MKLVHLSFALLLCIVITFQGCQQKSSTKVAVHIQRFDQELFAGGPHPTNAFFNGLNQKYGAFYESFCKDILSLNPADQDQPNAPTIQKFVTYPSILALHHEVDSVFPDLKTEEAALGSAMTKYKEAFPDATIPHFIAFLSEFGFAQVTYDSVVGIGLDMYLGSNYPLYPVLEFPGFMSKKLRREYIPANTIKSFAIGRFEGQLKDKRFLAMMLFEGKVRYFMKQLLPETPDSIIFGYSQTQLDWCHQNEKEMWAHYIEKKLLFSANVPAYMRYFNDGPFTIAEGVPQESAPSIAVYTGYRVIENYVQQTHVSLQELMNENNWDKLLKVSGYKP